MWHVNRIRVLFALALVSAVLPTLCFQTAEEKSARAITTQTQHQNLPNFHQVDTYLYRGAQPTSEGFHELEKMGIKTIISLRSNHSDRDLLLNTHLQLESIPLDTWNVTEADIVHFLKIATNPDRQPVFVHCQHGSDRTGTMCAAYRVVVQGWTKQQALEEMKRPDLGFHAIWGNLPKLIQNLDVEKIKHELPS